MGAALLCFCLSFSQPAPDRWLSEDKWKHFFASFAATSLSASAARLSGLDAHASVWAGIGAGAGVGIWKELRDHRARAGSASLRDLGWDAAGVAAGAVLLRKAR